MQSMVQSNSPSFRRGFTLLEVLLVLALIAAMAGMAYPSFEALISSRRLQNSARALAISMAETRVKAMNSGQAQVFSATIGGNDFVFEPWLDGYDEVDASAGATIKSAQTGMVMETDSTSGQAFPSSEQEKEPKQLESGVQFQSIDTLIDSRNAVAIETATGTASVPGVGAAVTSGTSNPILFYPDGTTTTAQIVLIDSQGRRWVVELRGVTGRISTFRTTATDSSAYLAMDPGASPTP